ncbi:MAG: sugar ABC transporter substrate-binding protein [Fimbriimonadaceae bacterium]|nr:sugar ABC transporter substrate-binding protein [Fimbriimonadaceae bacterium]
MKAFFSITLTILLILSVVAMATRSPDPGGPGRTTLVWATDNNPVRARQVELFNELNPDLFVVIDPMNAAREKVIVQSIGGVGPDLFDSFGYDSLTAFVNSGVAWDITDKLAEAGIDPQDDVWEVALSSFIRDGRVYGFPANVNADAIWFNKDMFDEAGVPYPRPGWTWPEVVETAKKLTKRDARGRPEQFGLYFSFDAWQSVLRSFGGRLWSEDGTQTMLDTPEAREALTTLQDLMYKHRVTPSPQEEAALTSQGGWGSGNLTFLMSGRVAMAFGGRWWLNLLRKDAPDMRLGVVEMPYPRRATLVGGARCVLVNSRSPRREAAVRFVKYLASEEYNRLLNDQADALAPMKRFSQGPRFELNPEYPEEDFNLVWRSVVEKATPEEVNPFVKGAELTPLNQQIDLMKSGLKDVPTALRDATRNMNARIRRQARIRPDLKKLWIERTGEQP